MIGRSTSISHFAATPDNPALWGPASRGDYDAGEPRRHDSGWLTNAYSSKLPAEKLRGTFECKER